MSIRQIIGWLAWGTFVAAMAGLVAYALVEIADGYRVPYQVRGTK
jgi:hypothetical protein